MMAPDGKIYGFPFYNFCQHCYWSAKMWINTELLDKYGLEMPTTTAEFEHVLEVFKQNGIIPLTGSTDGWNTNPVTFLMNAFIYDDQSQYFNIENGKVVFAPVKTEWKNGLKYIHNLFANGLIDKQAFSQKLDTLKQLVAQGKIGVVPSGYSGQFIETNNPNYSKWRTVPPLKGPDGVQYTAFFGNQPTSLTFVMTNKTTEQQRINVMKLLNFIYTPEGTQMLDFGQEGKYWTKAQPGEKGLDGKQALFNTQSDKFYSAGARQNEGWDQMGPIFQSEKWRNGFVVARPPFSPNGLESFLLLETMKNYAGHQPKEVYPGAIWIKPEDAQQYALYKTNINNYVIQWIAQFVMGSKSIDQDWDNYVKGFTNLGLDQYLKLSEQAMQKPFDTSTYKSDPGIVEFLSSLK
jgi:putative aldouronate transport system substrate-binding protein